MSETRRKPQDDHAPARVVPLRPARPEDRSASASSGPAAKSEITAAYLRQHDVIAAFLKRRTGSQEAAEELLNWLIGLPSAGRSLSGG